jgi:hypothetical protein
MVPVGGVQQAMGAQDVLGELPGEGVGVRHVVRQPGHAGLGTQAGGGGEGVVQVGVSANRLHGFGQFILQNNRRD